MYYALLGAVLLILYLYYKFVKPTKYWKEKGIAYVPSWPIIGSLKDFILRKKHFIDITAGIYKRFPKDRYVGYQQFNNLSLLIRDLDLIKQMGVKDFDHFHDHQAFTKSSSDPIASKFLISLTGEEWRKMRSTLSPVFTSSKMRNMYLLMKDCADNFVDSFHGKEQVAVEMKDIFMKYTTDVIATTAFGIKTDCVRQPENEFYSMAQSLFQIKFMQYVRMFVMQTLPAIANLFKFQAFPRDVTDFFRRVVKENIAKREAEGIVRPDLIHLLMQARKGQLKHDSIKETRNDAGFATVEESNIGKTFSERFELTDDHIVAQALLFFFAGFETSSTAASFVAYELAVHPDVQKKLQEEIDEAVAKSNGNVSHDTLLSLKYFDQVVSETLRLWPPAFQTDRDCTKEFVIKPVNPGEKPFVVEKGIQVVFPFHAIHTDPRYFPDPERFDPDRFSEENRGNIVPGSYMPFGVGPRNCIGSRFALLQVKTLFLSILCKFDIVPIDRTEIPLKISPLKMQLAPKDGIWLAFRPRKVLNTRTFVK